MSRVVWAMAGWASGAEVELRGQEKFFATSRSVSAAQGRGDFGSSPLRLVCLTFQTNVIK